MNERLSHLKPVIEAVMRGDCKPLDEAIGRAQVDLEFLQILKGSFAPAAPIVEAVLKAAKKPAVKKAEPAKASAPKPEQNGEPLEGRAAEAERRVQQVVQAIMSRGPLTKAQIGELLQTTSEAAYQFVYKRKDLFQREANNLWSLTNAAWQNGKEK